MSNDESGERCDLCSRVTKRGTTEHHLIPRTCHSNKWFKKRFSRQQMNGTIDLCRDCHRAIHEFITAEKDLGRHYNTVERLRANEEMAKFLIWVRRQK